MSIAQKIDHTALAPTVTKEEIKQLCQEAATYQFASVCVQPMWVSYAAVRLAETTIDICTVVGFPLGANTAEVKAFETLDAIANGATEIDMVIPVSAIKEQKEEIVREHIEAVVDAAAGTVVKVIIEASLLTDAEKVQACRIAKEAGAQFVKTSTGFSIGGATVEDIQLMRQTVGSSMGVKASGGVRTYEDAIKMIAAGASRIGASAGVQIVQEENR